MIFADHNDPTQWHNLLRINENGLGFSSDGGQTYKQAWTLDGKLVIGGTNVPSLTVYTSDAQTQTLFKVSRDGIVWNVDNSSMTADGTLTASGANLSNVHITGGDIWQENDGRHLQIINGNIHGGRTGGYENKVLLGVQADGIDGIQLNGNQVTFKVDRLYITDGAGSNTVYRGYNGDVVTDVTLDSTQIVDFYGNTINVPYVSQVNTKTAKEGLITN